MSNSAAQFETLVTTPEVVQGGLRNFVMNGGFDIWQRGMVFTINGEMTADRWRVLASGAGVPTASANQVTFTPGQTEVPGNPEFYVDFQAFLTPHLPSGTSSSLTNFIENVLLFEGERITVSFWMKGTITGTIAVVLSRGFGTGGSPRSTDPINEPTAFVQITSPNTWTKYVVKLDVPVTSTGKTLGPIETTVSGLNFATDTRDTTHDPDNQQVQYTGVVSLAQVQLSIGDIDDLEFVKRDVGLELTLCQRYYEINDKSETSFVEGGQHSNWNTFKVTKRVIPTITYFSREEPPTQSNVAVGTTTFPHTTDNGFQVRIFIVTPFANTNFVSIDPTDALHLTTKPWEADAEFA
jgi:hypothetical protein